MMRPKSKITVSWENTGKPAPKWFRKTKKAVTILADTATVILLGLGYSEDSMWMLIFRVGLSGLLEAAESVLANGEIYSNNNELKREK